MKKIKKNIKNQLKKIKKRYYRFLGYYPVNINDYRFKLNYERFDFWERVGNGTWEPQTFNVLSKFLKPNSVYIDIGAWIGPTVVFAANKCEKVICFEPDPIAFKFLLSNIESNNLRNVSPYNIAVSNSSSIQKMASIGGHLGDSMTSLLIDEKKSNKSFEALVLDWEFIESILNLDKVDMLKIDIEGGEFSLLPKMENFLKKYKPTLWLSFHTPFLSDRKNEQLEEVFCVLKNCYSICLNSDLEQIDFDELYNEKTLNNFPEYLFKN